MKTFNFPNQTAYYRGKVREVYTIGEDTLVSITSDRISAFDCILPQPIPFKGQVLNQLAAHFLNLSKQLVPNWVEAVPHPNVTIGKKCEPYKVEMVVRGYLAGHAWRTYQAGIRTLCGVVLPDGLAQNDPLPSPIITPTTKASEGHDVDISKQQIIDQGIVSQEEYHILEQYSLALYNFGTAYAKEKGLILVDTKFEFGKTREGQIVVIDEILSPDSSRYFYLEGYLARQQQGLPQKQLSKEFVREWLMQQGFQGLEGQKMPQMSAAVVQMISDRYCELFEILTAEKFVAHPFEEEAIEAAIHKAISEIKTL